MDTDNAEHRVDRMIAVGGTISELLSMDEQTIRREMSGPDINTCELSADEAVPAPAGVLIRPGGRAT